MKKKKKKKVIERIAKRKTHIKLVLLYTSDFMIIQNKLF